MLIPMALNIATIVTTLQSGKFSAEGVRQTWIICLPSQSLRFEQLYYPWKRAFSLSLHRSEGEGP
jgi:hypothetical protein